MLLILQPSNCACDCENFLGNLEEDEIGVVPTTVEPTTTTLTTETNQNWVVADNEEVSTIQGGAAVPKLVVQRSCGLQLMAGKTTRECYLITPQYLGTEMLSLLGKQFSR